MSVFFVCVSGTSLASINENYARQIFAFDSIDNGDALKKQTIILGSYMV